MAVDKARALARARGVTVDYAVANALELAWAKATYDVIVIDGHLRRELTALAFSYLAPGGVMVLDNAEGYGFWEELQGRNCRRVDFYGFAPGVSKRHCTSLVFVGDADSEGRIRNIWIQMNPAKLSRSERTVPRRAEGDGR